MSFIQPMAAFHGSTADLEELLADDVVQAAMRADGVTPSDVRRLVRSVIQRREARRAAAPMSSRAAVTRGNTVERASHRSGLCSV